jgi:hypothetical protein
VCTLWLIIGEQAKDWHQCLGRLTLGDGGMNLLRLKYLQAHSLHVFLCSSYDFCCILGSCMIIYTWSRGFDVRLGCTNWCSKRFLDVVSKFSEVCIPMKVFGCKKCKMWWKFAFQRKFLVARNVKCHESCIPMKFFGCKNCKMWGSLHSNEIFWLQE